MSTQGQTFTDSTPDKQDSPDTPQIPSALSIIRAQAGARGYENCVKCIGTTRQGTACKRNANKGRRYCNKHGGRALAGISHPAYKDGQHVGAREKRNRNRYPAAPQDWQETIEHATMDETIHSLEQEIALAEVMLNDLLRRQWEYGDPGKGWTTITNHWRLLQEAQSIGDIKAVQKQFATIGPLLERLQSAHMLDGEIREQLRLVAHLRMQEHKRLQELRTHIPLEGYISYLKEVQLAARRVALSLLDHPTAETFLSQWRIEVAALDVRRFVGAVAPAPQPLIDVTPA